MNAMVGDGCWRCALASRIVDCAEPARPGVRHVTREVAGSCHSRDRLRARCRRRQSREGADLFVRVHRSRQRQFLQRNGLNAEVMAVSRALAGERTDIRTVEVPASIRRALPLHSIRYARAASRRGGLVAPRPGGGAMRSTERRRWHSRRFRSPISPARRVITMPASTISRPAAWRRDFFADAGGAKGDGRGSRRLHAGATIASGWKVFPRMGADEFRSFHPAGHRRSHDPDKWRGSWLRRAIEKRWTTSPGVYSLGAGNRRSLSGR